MSKAKHHSATLHGYHGPFYPLAIEELHDLLVPIPYSSAWLKEVAAEVSGFWTMGRPTTDDGYVWFCSLLFNREHVKVVILFPWSQDWAKSDGTQSDRLTAVYANLKGRDVTTNKIVRDFMSAAKRRIAHDKEVGTEQMLDHLRLMPGQMS